MSMKMMEPGTDVILHVARCYEQPHNLRRMDGRRFKIKRVHWSGGRHTYELDGCRPSEGVPYTIMEDWIVPAKG